MAALPLRVAQVAVPVCVAVAVLRHRLLAIDLILNRALMFALATGVVAVGLRRGRRAGRARGRRQHRRLLAVAAGDRRGGAGVPAAPTPRRQGRRPAGLRGRGRAVRGAGRLQPPPRRQPRPGGPAAGRRRRGRTRRQRAARSWSPSTSRPAPTSVATWPPDARAGRRRGAGRGAGRRPRGTPGRIEVTMPPGHALRPLEKRLLADLAEQAALAFRSARLAAELSGEVERLARRTDDLAESRRRLISAGDAERSRLERAIDRQVAPHLAPLPDQLHGLSVAGRPTPTGDAGELAGIAALAEHRAGGAPGDHPRRLPGAARPLRPARGPGLARGESRRRRVASWSRSRPPGGASPARRGRGVLLRRRGDPRPRRSRPRRACPWRATGCRLVVTGTDRGGLARDDIRDRVEAAGGSVAITLDRGRTVVEVQLPDHTAASRSGPNAALVT